MDAKHGIRSAMLRTKGKIMQASNGFGSVIQEIVFHVDAASTAQVAAILSTTPFKEAGDPPRAYFLWSRASVRRRDDESAVFELSMLLDGKRIPISWEVDWQASKY
jgi:hypothetical protein